jgi:hypothetical protein
MRNERTAAGVFVAIGVALASGACASADTTPTEPSPTEEIGTAVQAWGTPPATGFIDWDRTEEALPDELEELLETSGKVAKLLSDFKTGADVGIFVLQLLGVIATDDEMQDARFASLVAKLDAVGAALSSQMTIEARENRLSDMRSYVNDINRLALHSLNGFVDESRLSGSDVDVLGNARSFSQTVAQAATNSIAFRKIAPSSYGNAEWTTYIHERPAVQDGLVFDWRLGTTEVVHLINSRLAILALTDPNYRSENATELNDYRAALESLYAQIMAGIKCGSSRADQLMVICADIHAGFSAKTTVYEPRCGSNYSHGLCNERIEAEKKTLVRAVMMRTPLFELRALIDAITALLTFDPDLTGSTSGGPGAGGIRVQGTGQSSCLGEFHGFTIDNPDDPWNATIDETRWLALVQACNGGVDQRWTYSRFTGRITNASNACVGSGFAPGSAIVVQPCSNSPGERWTYNPETGVLENAYHTVLAAPAAPWISAVPVNAEKGQPGSVQSWDDTREPYNLGYWHWGTTHVSSDPYWRGGDVAIDGDTNGEWSHGSVTHTDAGLNQWGGGQYWVVDLHQPYWINQVTLWNRTDCCWDRLSHFHIAAWDPLLSAWRMVADRSNLLVTSSDPIAVPVGVTAQYLMVAKSDAQILSLAEVEVLGF